MAELVNQGNLLPDALILRVLRERMAAAAVEGSARFLLDGFPRTAEQAAALEGSADVQLALNLDLREEVLVEKCLGRRLCTKCGKNYNVADIHLAAGKGRPEIVMPPLSPPPECAPFMEQRSDDNEETIRRRLEVGDAPSACRGWLPGGGLRYPRRWTRMAALIRAILLVPLAGLQAGGNAGRGFLPQAGRAGEL